MKQWISRAVSLLCGCGLLLLVSCGTGGGAAPAVTRGFTADAAAAYGEMTLQGKVRCAPDGKLQLTVSQPKSLSGVTIGWDGTDMTMELAGTSVKIPPEKVPESAFINELLAVLTAEHPVGQSTDEGTAFTGQVNGMAYTLVCDADSGLPKSLSVPENEMTVTFSNVAVWSGE